MLPPYLAAAEELRRNSEQWKVYESQGHCVVLAGPGSGKTKVLTVKLARLLAEDIAPPRGIACLTYNNECARELVRRLARLGVRSARNVFIGTVHSFCLKAVVLPYAHLCGLALPDPVRVATPTDQEKLFSTALGRVVSVNERPEEWRRRCDRYRRTYLDRDGVGWRGQDPQVAQLIEEYESLLRKDGFIDFDDMVLLGLRMVESQAWVRKTLIARFPALVVDEYQDLGLALHRLVLSLCFGDGKNCRLLAVGDPDQSIYSFTGAQPELLSNLAGDGRVEVVRLRLNYRSRASIVSASEVALGEPRGYVAAAGDGGIIEFHKCPDGLRHQARFTCEELVPRMLKTKAARNLGEMAVLYKDKTQGDVVAECAAAGYDFIRTDANAPYRCTPLTMWLEGCAAWCSGGWEKGEPALSDLVGRWRALNGSVASDSELLALNRQLVRFLFSHRGCDSALGEWLRSIHEACLREAFAREPLLSDEASRFTSLMGLCEEGKKLAAWSVRQFGGQGGTPDHLNLMTLHSAKGLEFDVVFMLGLDQGIIPGWGQTTPASKREPRRLFYVGLTRARYEVHMLYSGWRDSPYGRKYDGPSEFLLEVQKAVEG